MALTQGMGSPHGLLMRGKFPPHPLGGSKAAGCGRGSGRGRVYSSMIASTSNSTSHSGLIKVDTCMIVLAGRMSAK